MVKAPRKTSRSRRIRPLNAPTPARVKKGPDGEPWTVVMERIELPVNCVDDRWRLDDEWWRERPVCRLYLHILLEDGRRITVFKDLTDNHWYEQRYT